MTALLAYDELAKLVSMPVGTLRSMVARKQIPHVRIAPRIVRFRPDEIEQWLASKAVRP